MHTHLEKLLQDGAKVLVNSLLRLGDKRPPDVRHGIPNAGIGVILVPVQFGDQVCNVGTQLLPSQLSYRCKSASVTGP